MVWKEKKDIKTNLAGWSGGFFEGSSAITAKSPSRGQDDDASQQDPDVQKKPPCRRLRPSEMVGQDGHRTPLARLSIHGAGHQTQEAPEARRSRHQSIGQTGETAQHRLQSGQDSAREVESRRHDDQGHRQVTGQQISGRKDGQEDHASQEKAEIVNVNCQACFFFLKETYL